MTAQQVNRISCCFSIVASYKFHCTHKNLSKYPYTIACNAEPRDWQTKGCHTVFTTSLGMFSECDVRWIFTLQVVSYCIYHLLNVTLCRFRELRCLFRPPGLCFTWQISCVCLDLWRPQVSTGKTTYCNCHTKWLLTSSQVLMMK